MSARGGGASSLGAMTITGSTACGAHDNSTASPMMPRVFFALIVFTGAARITARSATTTDGKGARDSFARRRTERPARLIVPCNG